VLQRSEQMGGVRRLGLKASNLLVPPVCLGCRASLADHHALCPHCWRNIAFIRAPLCDRMGIPLPFDATGGRDGPSVSAAALAEPPDYDRARAAAHFSGTIRKLVHDFKYADRQEVRVLLAQWLMAAGHELLSDAHVIVPVPMGRRRLFWRTFNQAAILAHELGRRSGIAVDTAALKRRRATRPQVGLTRAQRRDNLEGAFAVLKRRQGRIGGHNVLLIDDVITTGATANACARALKRAGAARVDVLAVALVAGEVPLVP
jgi:ComF family protein